MPGRGTGSFTKDAWFLAISSSKFLPKNVTFNSKSNHSQKLSLNVKGPKEVLSSDFEENPEVEIIDKDAVIMNVDSNREVNLEIF